MDLELRGVGFIDGIHYITDRTFFVWIRNTQFQMNESESKFQATKTLLGTKPWFSLTPTTHDSQTSRQLCRLQNEVRHRVSTAFLATSRPRTSFPNPVSVSSSASRQISMKKKGPRMSRSKFHFGNLPYLIPSLACAGAYLCLFPLVDSASPSPILRALPLRLV